MDKSTRYRNRYPDTHFALDRQTRREFYAVMLTVKASGNRLAAEALALASIELGNGDFGKANMALRFARYYSA